jgi:hypothetical protein
MASSIWIDHMPSCVDVDVEVGVDVETDGVFISLLSEFLRPYSL